MKYLLPKLPYSFDALEPYVDSRTMEIHYSKHHQAYADKLNAVLEKYPSLQEKPAEELLKSLDEIPQDIRTAVKNNGGGYVNHSFFWQILAKGVQPKGKIVNAIKKQFGGMAEFTEFLTAAALARFGSGWAWLVLSNGKLEICNTSNQDSPLSEGKIPLLGIDLWEHAYYLKYQNRRAEYISAFWNIINWKKVNELYEDAMNYPNL